MRWILLCLLGVLIVYVVTRPVGSCVSNCSNKQCGLDLCGSSCGTCKADQDCVNFRCISRSIPPGCIPNCGDKQCGSDGCSGTCGKCTGDQECVNFRCVNSVQPDISKILKQNPNARFRIVNVKTGLELTSDPSTRDQNNLIYEPKYRPDSPVPENVSQYWQFVSQGETYKIKSSDNDSIIYCVPTNLHSRESLHCFNRYPATYYLSDNNKPELPDMYTPFKIEPVVDEKSGILLGYRLISMATNAPMYVDTFLLVAGWGPEVWIPPTDYDTWKIIPV